ncbi:MAG TPA: TonB family protein [Polyangia bacterium]|nr:TonB family protein [Polyangia bacterium]
MARRDGMRRGSRRSFSGLLITIALHGGIFWAVKTAHGRPQEPLIVPRDFVQAEMVKLGKPRDKFWLPKAHVTPPPPPPDAIKLSQNADAGAAPPEAPKLTDPKTSKAVKSALARADKLTALITEPDDEGSLTGSKMGTSDHQVGDPYDAQVMSAITQNYNLPAGLTPEQIAQPPEIKFKVNTDGTLVGAKLLKSSGNPLVDDACVSAAQMTRRVQNPPGGKPRVYAVACQK